MAELLHRVLVTGASGFVGRHLRTRLPAPVNTVSLGAADWQERVDAAPLAGAVVFHLAARAHSAGSEDEFQRDNVEKTRILAEAALREGASRFVYLSSVKVHGEESRARAFEPQDPLDPQDAYARSKAAAERALGEVAAKGLPVTIVRAPLVYGAGARANLAQLAGIADSPWPLPFAAFDARRSFVHARDLADALVAAGSREGASGKSYLVAHPHAPSIAEVVTLMRRHLGRPPRLWGMRPATFETFASYLGQGEKARRLTRPLLADPAAAERELGWSARVPIAEAIEELVRDRRAEKNR
jgi:nucleoside-diphosphate-sugar epimerase